MVRGMRVRPCCSGARDGMALKILACGAGWMLSPAPAATGALGITCFRVAGKRMEA